MRVLVCGSRTWNARQPMFRRLVELRRSGYITVVHGGAKGADQLAGRIARALAYREEVHKPDWRAHGRAAGFVRNKEMVDSKPDLVLAFWDGKSRGTQDTIRRAKLAGIPVEVITLDSP